MSPRKGSGSAKSRVGDGGWVRNEGRIVEGVKDGMAWHGKGGARKNKKNRKDYEKEHFVRAKERVQRHFGKCRKSHGNFGAAQRGEAYPELLQARTEEVEGIVGKQLHRQWAVMCVTPEGVEDQGLWPSKAGRTVENGEPYDKV